MTTYQDALATIERLPQMTRDIEDVVHRHGVPPDVIARKLGVPENEILSHLRAARDARNLLVEAGCAGENRATKSSRLIQAIDLAREGMLRPDIAKAVGWQTATVKNQFTKARARSIEVPKLKPGRPRSVAAKLERAIGLVRGGVSHADIAQAVGWTTVTLSCEFSRARRRGVDIPLGQQARPNRQGSMPTGTLIAAALFGIQPSSTVALPEQDRKRLLAP